MAWIKATLTTKGGQVTHRTTMHEATQLHALKWRTGYILMSTDGLEIARFRLRSGLRAWVEENGPKSTHPWTSEGVSRWRKEDPEGCGKVFGPLHRVGQYHLH